MSEAQDQVERARALFEAGNLLASREAALAGLASDPDHVGLLRLAGRAGVELDLEEAVGELQKVVELVPDDAQAWQDYGDALAAEGKSREATQAFERAVELNPDDETSLTNLGHAAAATGDTEQAIGYLAQAAERGPGNSTAAISLVEMYKSVGKPEDALAAATRIAEAEPEDVLAVLDVAELSQALGRSDQAYSAYERMREIDDVPDHEVYALHGMIGIEIERDQLARARELAQEAVQVDPHGRTKDVLTFLEAEAGGEAPDAIPTMTEVRAALTASLSEHRRLHAEDRRLGAEDFA